MHNYIPFYSKNKGENVKISMEEVEEARKIKKNKKGGFEDKVYLIDVEEE